MLHITILAVGKLKEEYLTQGVAEYAKRLGAFCRLEVLEIDEYRLSKEPGPAEIERGLEEEGRRLLAKIPARAQVFPLCIEGMPLSSVELARVMGAAQGESSHVVFIIGGSHGLSPQVKAAGKGLSMSPMTFPHQLARLMLLEQIYRALSILGNRKYHK